MQFINVKSTSELELPPGRLQHIVQIVGDPLEGTLWVNGEKVYVDKFLVEFRSPRAQNGPGITVVLETGPATILVPDPKLIYRR